MVHGTIGKQLTLIARMLVIALVVASSARAQEHEPAERGGDAKPAEARIEPAASVSWKDGKTIIDTPNAQLNISNRVQVRFTLDDPESGEEKGSFRIRRGKTKFDGWFYDRNLTYELQLNWPDTANPLEDANINYDLGRGSKSFMLKTGQFKVPFGRQELTSSGAQQFVDRSIVSNEFAKGRDAGLQAWGLPMKGKLDWRVGIFNGNGRTRSANDNDRFQYNARLTWQPFGDVKYSESDFESRDRPLFALGGGYEKNDLRGATTGNDTGRDVVGIDVVFKFRGFSAFAEYFDRENHPESGRDSSSDGLTAQAGYFVIPGKLELAARYASWDPSNLVPSNDRSEIGAAVSWYWNRHNLKLQGDYRILEDDARESEDNEARLQLQFIF